MGDQSREPERDTRCPIAPMRLTGLATILLVLAVHVANSRSETTESNPVLKAVQFATLSAGTNSGIAGAFESDSDSPATDISGQQLVYTVGNLTSGNNTTPALRTQVASILKGYNITINATVNGTMVPPSVNAQLQALSPSQRNSLYSDLTTASLVAAFALPPTQPRTASAPAAATPTPTRNSNVDVGAAFAAALTVSPPPSEGTSFLATPSETAYLRWLGRKMQQAA